MATIKTRLFTYKKAMVNTPSWPEWPKNKINGVNSDIFDVLQNWNKEKLSKLLNILVNIYNSKHKEKISNSQIEEIVNEFSKLDDESLMDCLIFRLAKWIKKGVISEKDVYENIELILDLYPEKFKTFDDLKTRYKYLKWLWLREDNMNENYKEKIKENHKNVIEVFDKFNKLIFNLINDWLDCFYTWWLVGYFWTNTELERYHTDIDIYLNIDDLEKLKIFIENNKDSWFKFIDNLKNKWPNGHEYMIKFWDNPVPIWIFLFKKSKNWTTSRIEYYYNEKWDIATEETPIKGLETELWSFNNTTYKRQSLKSIYESKKNSNREKDQHDAKLIAKYLKIDN